MALADTGSQTNKHTTERKEKRFLLNPLKKIGKDFDNLGLGQTFIPGTVPVGRVQ